MDIALISILLFYRDVKHQADGKTSRTIRKGHDEVSFPIGLWNCWFPMRYKLEFKIFVRLQLSQQSFFTCSSGV